MAMREVEHWWDVPNKKGKVIIRSNMCWNASPNLNLDLIGCHTALCYSPTGTLILPASSPETMPYLRSKGLISEDELKAYYPGQHVTICPGFGSEEFRTKLVEWALSDIADQLPTTPGIILMGDNINNPNKLLVKPASLVKYIMDARGWAVWGSPIILNPNHDGENKKGIPHYCQVWAMVPPNGAMRVVPGTSFSHIPESFKAKKTRVELMNDWNKRDLKHDVYDPSIGRYKTEPYDPEDIQRGWDMWDRYK